MSRLETFCSNICFDESRLHKQHKISEEIRKINQEDGVVVLLTEQNLDFAMDLTGQALVMEKGKIVRQLSSHELLKDKDIQAEYLGV